MEPQSRWRVIIDTDAKNEADDQFAIVHGLLSPSLEVRGLIAAHFGLVAFLGPLKFGSPTSSCSAGSAVV